MKVVRYARLLLCPPKSTNRLCTGALQLNSGLHTAFYRIHLSKSPKCLSRKYPLNLIKYEIKILTHCCILLDFLCESQAVSVQQLHVQQPSTYAKPEAASAILGSWWWAVCRPKHVELYKYEIKFWYTVASCCISYVNFTMTHGCTNIKAWPYVQN